MQQEEIDYSIVIHGGAGAISQEDATEEERDMYLESLREALTAGEEVLVEGGSALDAVETANRVMEDDSLFNAGKGAVFTNDGEHELDASIMDGRDLQAGAITAVRTVKNPISLARKVKEESRHILFAADGAERFADEMNVERVDQDYFFTQRRYRALQEALGESSVRLDHDQQSGWQRDMSTVGVAAKDMDGNLAAGTTTGGMTNKMFGRVGDVPIIGHGTYADNNNCAVSTTGHGEKFMMNVSSHQVCAMMEYQGATLEEATNHIIHEKMDPGDGGMIAVDPYGNHSLVFSSEGMYRGVANSEGVFQVAIWDEYHE